MKGDDTQRLDLLCRQAALPQCSMRALLHLIGGGACEGHAEDGFGRDTLIGDEAHESLHKDGGFAGAGGGDEGGGAAGVGDSVRLLRIGGKEGGRGYTFSCLLSCSLRNHSPSLPSLFHNIESRKSTITRCGAGWQ